MLTLLLYLDYKKKNHKFSHCHIENSKFKYSWLQERHLNLSNKEKLAMKCSQVYQASVIKLNVELIILL